MLLAVSKKQIRLLAAVNAILMILHQSGLKNNNNVVSSYETEYHHTALSNSLPIHSYEAPQNTSSAEAKAAHGHSHLQ